MDAEKTTKTKYISLSVKGRTLIRKLRSNSEHVPDQAKPNEMHWKRFHYIREEIARLYREVIHLSPKATIVLVLLLFPLSSYANSEALTFPEVEEGIPKPGKLVKVYLQEYPEAYYVVFLPYNYTEGAKFPVIFESPANGYPRELPFYEGLFLGYGISRGIDYILVSVPCVDTTGQILKSSWGKDPLSTVNFWLAVLHDLSAKFHIFEDRIILAGFSRGAVSTSYIGNYNNEIKSKWCAYFAYAHFDGCCQTCLGDPDKRIKRINGRKVLIAVGENDTAKKCSKEAYLKLKAYGFPATYIEHHDIHTDKCLNLSHNPFWILEDSEPAQKAREWLKDLFKK